MFCPRCAAQNVDDAKYCRACGADISLVPQAVSGELAGRLTEGEGGRKRQRQKEHLGVEGAVRQFFMGVAFVLVSLSVLFFMPGGQHWWFWMLIPAFIFIGGGVGAYLRHQEERKRLAPPAFAPAQQPLMQTPPRATELPPRRDTGQVVSPPSVTEGTTRHLGVPAERTPKDV